MDEKRWRAQKPHSTPVARCVGIGLSLLLSGLIVWLSIPVLSGRLSGWDGLGAILFALFVLAPLTIVVVGMWAYCLWRSQGAMPFTVHALMLGAPLTSAMIIPIGNAVSDYAHSRFTVEHPSVTETHINLTGNELVLKTAGYTTTSSYPILWADRPEEFVQLRIWPNPELVANGVSPYDGARLRSDVRQYDYAPNVYVEPQTPAAAPVPIVRAAYPDVSPLIPIISRTEAAALVLQYFHYLDRVELAPAIRRFAASQTERMTRDNMPGLVLFTLYDYAAEPIARLEVNGQALDLGERAVEPTPALPAPCKEIAMPVGAAFADLSQPIAVRWQTTRQPGQWNESTIVVPSFPSPLRPDEAKVPDRVLLYVLPEAAVAAERYVEFRTSNNQLGVRTTGVPETAKRIASCAGAADAYNPATVDLRAH